MYKIIRKKKLAANIFHFEVKAPEIAKRRKPGQFVMIRLNEEGERIPLTIVEADSKEGNISLIFQAVGKTTEEMAEMEVGNSILDIVGPLGLPTEIKNFGTVICVGGGLGIALIYPLAKAMKEGGNKVISIISARQKDLLIMQAELKKISDEVKIATDDGSCGYHGFPTDILQGIIKSKKTIDLVIAVGPVPLMESISKVTNPYKIRTIVSLNPIMVDGTGMCGGCRVTVSGETKFVCVDGPEFDGHKVDFKELSHRLKIYEKEEKQPKKEVIIAHPTIYEVKPLPKSVKRQISRQKSFEQNPQERIKNFQEVTSTYTLKQAKLEAERCLQCKRPFCQEGCPADVDIPGFISFIKKGDFSAAARKIKEASCLPAVCGRVCPAEDQCEKSCILGRKGKPVAIGNLERFVIEQEQKTGKIEVPHKSPSQGKKVAIVGSGPAGLTTAGDLVKLGYQVIVFEALHKAGGVLMYGIPEFRLPKSIVQNEVDYLKKLGVEFKLDYVIGKLYTVDELFKQGFQAVFLGTGAGLPRFLGIPGENLNGVLSANEYLTRSNLMKAYNSHYQTPIVRKKQVAVIGGGNVALDSARTALRLGAEEVILIYRRSRKEMPARDNEIQHGEEEGLKFQFLTNPLRILGNEKGWVKGIECLKMELGEPDESGRRRPIPLKGSAFILKVGMVIVAIGNGPHPLVPQTTHNLKTNKWGNIIVKEDGGRTTKEGVFAGGDIVTGAATVISAMGAGRKAARAIDKYLTNPK